MNKNYLLAVKIFISVVILTVLFSRIDFRELWAQINNLSWLFIIFALIYYTFCQYLSCIRWQIILKASKKTVPMIVLLKSYFGGMFLNTFLPSSIGGDIYRVYTISKVSNSGEIAFVSVFLERITGLFALLGIALISIPPAFNLINNWKIVSILLSCTIILIMIAVIIMSQKVLKQITPLLIKLHLQKIAKKFANIQILLRRFASQGTTLWQSMILSMILQLLIVYYYYIIARQLNIEISYLYLLIFIPIIVVITLFPISLGGLGLKEGLLAYLFTQVNLSIEQAVSLSLTATALGWLLSLPGGVILWFDKGYQSLGEKQIEELQHQDDL